MVSHPRKRLKKMSNSLPSEARRFGRPESGLRRELYYVIFESDTRAGRLFDQLLIYTVLLECGATGLAAEAKYCHRCGASLAAQSAACREAHGFIALGHLGPAPDTRAWQGCTASHLLILAFIMDEL